jgi:hypothetical protein
LIMIEVVALIILVAAVPLHAHYIRTAPEGHRCFTYYYATGLFAYTWPVWQAYRIFIALRMHGVNLYALKWMPLWRLPSNYHSIR